MFDLRKVPFSAFGSYFAVSRFENVNPGQDGLFLRTVHARDYEKPLFRLEMVVNSNPVPFRETVNPHMLSLVGDQGRIDICISEPKVIRMRGTGVGLRLTASEYGPYGCVAAQAENRWELNLYSQKLMLSPLTGTLHVKAPWDRMRCTEVQIDTDAESGEWEFALDEFQTGWKPRSYEDSFDAAAARVKHAFAAFRDSTPTSTGKYDAARELADYVCWSSVVQPESNHKRPSMYMSKNWMCNVWSWDHCFNAMGLIHSNPDLAWDQFMIMIDHQDDMGAFPDSVNDSRCNWGFAKPPIHGWALKWMMERSDFINVGKLRQVYEPLSRWTEWWFTYRDSRRNGFPEYHHGNDSGWDNCTNFHEGVPVASPDLCAFLVLQMEVLAEIAAALRMPAEAHEWRTRSEKLLERMVEYYWQAGSFTAKRVSTQEPVRGCDSLFVYLPIVLGKRLPNHVLSQMTANLSEENRFLTPYGLATESVQSPLYEDNGYWRGPIWAPPTILIVDGLMNAGETALAKEISTRFCDMVADQGMAENFNALTGEGLCDLAYTWTASIFLILANSYTGDQ